jgi:hypothetical protein
MSFPSPGRQSIWNFEQKGPMREELLDEVVYPLDFHGAVRVTALLQPYATWLLKLSPVMAQIWRKCSGDVIVQSIPLPMRGPTGKQDTLGHCLLQVPLERAPWRIRRPGLEHLQVGF